MSGRGKRLRKSVAESSLCEPEKMKSMKVSEDYYTVTQRERERVTNQGSWRNR